jgi:OmpA-OmpF porin, OOP family
MKKILFLLFMSFSFFGFAQTKIIVKNEDGLLLIPCKANGLQACFIFSEEESENLVSQKQAMYMFRNEFFHKPDIVGVPRYDSTDEETLSEGVVLTLKDFQFAGLKIANIKCTIVKDMDAPFLIGKSTVAGLGETKFDKVSNTLTIASGTMSFDFSKINMAFEMPKETPLPKDAPINVTVTDFKGKVLPNEIMVFKSKKKKIEFQNQTNDLGQFSTRLPAGDVYQIYILGFNDSTTIDSLVIPALEGRKYYKNPFVVTYKFLPAKSFVLDNCNFDNGKATLQDSSFKVLDELVAYLVRKDDEKIEIGGHTDNVGSAVSNQKLSEDRAKTVRDYLISKGIDATRLTYKGYGMTKPVADNKTASGRAENRRTEVTIL